ncbi:MAG: PQQ-dependent sugar dehydrogenase [Thermoanaerobaculia bacterium]
MRFALAVVVLVLTAAPAATQKLELRPVAEGLTSPVSIAHAGDSRLFITQQNGRIAVFDGTRVLTDPFLDLSSLITSGGERGLLSVAFHPRYASNGFFFVNYTDTRGDTVVARYSVSLTDPNRANPSSAVVILTIAQPFANHNGGQLQFGPDGYLYVGTGDGGSGGDPGNRAQNLSDLLGKILRLDVDAASAIPATNPFLGRSDARPEVWAFGLRNPWRFTFDRTTGDLWIADVGQGSWEEINLQPASSLGGENYGWRRMEGSHCFNPPSGCNDPALVRPVIEYGHEQGACSVTGGYVYRGTRYRRLQGAYLYGDFCNGMIWAASREGVTWTPRLLADTSLLITTFGEDVSGELYVADFRGTVYQIVDASQQVPPRRRAVGHR